MDTVVSENVKWREHSRPWFVKLIFTPVSIFFVAVAAYSLLEKHEVMATLSLATGLIALSFAYGKRTGDYYVITGLLCFLAAALYGQYPLASAAIAGAIILYEVVAALLISGKVLSWIWEAFEWIVIIFFVDTLLYWLVGWGGSGKKQRTPPIRRGDDRFRK